MSKRYIRESLENITKHNLYITNLYDYFLKKSEFDKSIKLELESDTNNLYGKEITALDLTIKNSHGLIFKLSSNIYAYDIFNNYIVGNYSMMVDKWKYSPIHIKLYSDFDTVYSLFKELGKHHHMKKLVSNKEYINILYSDLLNVYNI